MSHRLPQSFQSRQTLQVLAIIGYLEALLRGLLSAAYWEVLLLLVFLPGFAGVVKEQDTVATRNRVQWHLCLQKRELSLTQSH